jgi:Uma2 family endonuclease
MDPKPSSGAVLLAPASSAGAGALRLPASQDFPSLDDHLVEPETPVEMIRGRRVEVTPAKPPHADGQFKLSYVIGAHVRPGYVGSSELLTRAGVGSDFATDVSVRRQGTNPETDTRYLEELAFEVVNEQFLRDITEKAEDLTARGVRRIIAVFVKKGEVCEWTPRSGGWKKLEPEATFSDPTLARPLRVRELLDAAEADNAVVLALVAKGNPAIAKVQEQSRAEGEARGRAEGEARGRAEGARATVRDLCELLDIPLTPARQAELAQMQIAELDALRERLKRDRRWE